ncbi:MAG: CPBP family intramembrane glutamic endopeptidase, partial [Betaproteobacteria bacterium]
MILEKRKSFWVALLLAALLSVGAAAWLFPKAMPLLQLQVSLSRDQALDAAAALQAQRFSELTTTRAEAGFEHDDTLQNYIELEGGGAAAYTALLGQRFIAPYHWSVRRFSESQEDELSVRFTPEGFPYGFTRKVPEKAPGAALTEAPARVIAEAGARSLLGEALWKSYAPLSASQVTRPGGRIDHSLVYEHQGEQRAQARFRLKLVVAGEQLIELTPYAFVPQAFEQRFTQLRDGNETIAKVANIMVFSLYGLVGLLGGWLWLARCGGLAWKPALVGGGVVGGLLGAAVLSNLPMAWLDYATTDSASSFLLRHSALALGNLVATTLLLGLIFAVAEGLSRRAFAQHPRLFDFWSVAAAASPQALGRTLGGYAWMAIELLAVSGFYLLARTQFGWWVPTGNLSDPNILSAWRPALEPIANALQAGTMEEALFRAVPLAGAALIGARIGWRRSAIAVALVLQALVFASAHAGYPGLPSYSRVVELFLPALVWGLIFLRYGLVPCMIMHFTFDLVLMSLPLFVASDSRLWLDRGLVLLAGLAPLLMVARARFKQGYFAELASSWRNGETVAVAAAATPEPVTPVPASEAPADTAARPWWLQRSTLLLGAVIGMAAVLLWPAPQVHTANFTLDHAAAVARAELLLAERGVRFDADWKRLAVVRGAAGGDTKALRFVWREAGPQVFERLLGSSILPQHWQVLFKHPSGPVEERAEVWEVALTGQGEVLAVEHHLPEGRPGAKLEREQAQALVRSYMEGQRALANRPWTLVSAEQKERPARRDWTFYWDDKQALDVKGGTSRVAVTLRGDELSAWQYVFVPD